MIMTTSEIIEWSEGNLGGLNFLMMLNNETNVYGVMIYSKLFSCREIRGWKLWVLYKDLCEGDMMKVAWLAIRCENSILTEACSTDDRSGKELVAPLFERLEIEKVGFVKLFG